MNFLVARSMNTTLFSTLFAAFLLLISSCSVVKDYPAQRPFIYNTNIELQGKFTTDERKGLTSQLREQLHDSIMVRRIEKLIGWEKGPRFFYSVLQNPPAYDSLNADKSLGYMEALLHSLGYYRDTITYQVNVDAVGDQYRTMVNFSVVPGSRLRVGARVGNLVGDGMVRVSQRA